MLFNHPDLAASAARDHVQHLIDDADRHRQAKAARRHARGRDRAAKAEEPALRRHPLLVLTRALW
jgi:hypothetical protein